LLTAAVIGTGVMRSAGADVVEIRVNGHYFSEPATIEIIVAVRPDKANRTLRIEADGERMFRSTEVTLEGDSEKRLHTVEFKNLAAGTYELRAEVFSDDRVRGTAVQDFEVAGH
jgi:hypothetical protein